MATRVVTLLMIIGNKARRVSNEIETQAISDHLFLEFGKRVGEQYEYVSLMEGDANYRNGKDVRQLYFAHHVSGKWRVLDDTCLKLVEDYKTKEQAVARLRELAKS